MTKTEREIKKKELDDLEIAMKSISYEQKRTDLRIDLEDRVNFEYMDRFIEEYKDIFEIDYIYGVSTHYDDIADHIVITFAGEVVYEASGPNKTIGDIKLRKSDLENFLKEKDYKTISEIFLF